MLKDMDFYHLQDNIKKQLLDTQQGTVKTFQKSSSCEFLGNKNLFELY